MTRQITVGGNQPIFFILIKPISAQRVPTYVEPLDPSVSITKVRMNYSYLLTVVCLAFVVAMPARATSGQLDPSFGRGGVVVTHFGNDVRPIDAALQADGKLVVVGGLNDFKIASELAVVIRYLPHGSLDETFGLHGAVGTTSRSCGSRATARATRVSAATVGMSLPFRIRRPSERPSIR